MNTNVDTLKREILSNDILLAILKHNKREQYKKSKLILDANTSDSFAYLLGLETLNIDIQRTKLCETFGYENVKVAENIIHAQWQRVSRIRKRFEKMLTQPNPIFITLNFDDDALQLKDDSRRQAVIRYLKKYCISYIANQDFGNDEEYIDRHGNKRHGTMREHYHALIIPKYEKMPLNAWKYGFAYTKRVRLGDEKELTMKRLPKYLAKLTNHCIKESNKSMRVIYSRNLK